MKGVKPPLFSEKRAGGQCLEKRTGVELQTLSEIFIGEDFACDFPSGRDAFRTRPKFSAHRNGHGQITSRRNVEKVRAWGSESCDCLLVSGHKS